MTEKDAPRGDYENDPDTRLMVRLAAGDESAFDRIVGNFERQVYGIIYRYIGNTAGAEDCAQEVFLRLYKTRKTYKPTARLSTLIYRITTNLCLNLLRDEKRRRMVSLDADYGDDTIPLSAFVAAEGEAADEAAVAKERGAIVRAALAGIPDRQRMALVLHRFEGLSYADIAEAMDTNVDAVKALLSRARRSLAEALRADIEAGNV